MYVINYYYYKFVHVYMIVMKYINKTLPVIIKKKLSQCQTSVYRERKTSL